MKLYDDDYPMFEMMVLAVMGTVTAMGLGFILLVIFAAMPGPMQASFLGGVIALSLMSMLRRILIRSRRRRVIRRFAQGLPPSVESAFLHKIGERKNERGRVER